MFFEINKSIFNYLNSFANTEVIEKIVCIFSDAPIFFLPIFLVTMWLYYVYKKLPENKNNLLFIFYSAVLWIIISIIIQQFVHIDRPENYIETTWKLLLKHIPDASFPSDHATVSFAFLTSLFLANYKKIWLIFLPFVILMNLSRVIAWVHWPFDIIAWAIVWIFSSFYMFKYINKLDFIKKMNNIIINLLSLIKL